MAWHYNDINLLPLNKAFYQNFLRDEILQNHFRLKPFFSIRQIAIASPITICAVVLLVGARLFGQASCVTVVFRKKLLFLQDMN